LFAMILQLSCNVTRADLLYYRGKEIYTMTLENGKTYELTNKSGAKTIVTVKGNKVYGLNGANCGTVKSFTSNPRFSTLAVAAVTK